MSSLSSSHRSSSLDSLTGPVTPHTNTQHLRVVHKHPTPRLVLFTTPNTPLSVVHKHQTPLFVVFTNTQHPSSLCSQTLNTLLSCIQLNAVHKHQTPLCCLQTSNTALGCLLYCCCFFLLIDKTTFSVLFLKTLHHSHFYSRTPNATLIFIYKYTRLSIRNILL